MGESREGGGVKCGSLFAGIGGLDLGLERAGMKVVWQVEKDEYCRRVLAKHWPDVTRYEDVKDVGAHNLEPVDLISGGFPCQPVSVAGKRKAQDDERWLWPEFARIIRELRPRYALVENGDGLATAVKKWPTPTASDGIGGGEEVERDPENSHHSSSRTTRQTPRGDPWWSTEPDVGRVAHGVPARVDRLGALGNAVVPQVAEYVGRRIMSAEVTT